MTVNNPTIPGDTDQTGADAALDRDTAATSRTTALVVRTRETEAGHPAPEALAGWLAA